MSNLLLVDTRAFLWMGMQPKSLPVRVRGVIEDSENQLFLSVASIWEISIKKSLGKLKLPVPTTAFVNSLVALGGIEILTIDTDHAIGVEELERIHGDPFDRLLVSQARHLGLSVISSDSVFDSYKVKRIW
jgi:PIN domain nuclease of toxin-antitoxin system